MDAVYGTVLKYIDPTDPVAVDEWGALDDPDQYSQANPIKERKMVASILPSAETIEVTEDYKIVIPPSLAEELGIHPGQKLQAIFYQGRIEIVPEIDPLQARGSMPGLDTIVDPETPEE